MANHPDSIIHQVKGLRIAALIRVVVFGQRPIAALRHTERRAWREVQHGKGGAQIVRHRRASFEGLRRLPIVLHLGAVLRQKRQELRDVEGPIDPSFAVLIPAPAS